MMVTEKSGVRGASDSEIPGGTGRENIIGKPDLFLRN